MKKIYFFLLLPAWVFSSDLNTPLLGVKNLISTTISTSSPLFWILMAIILSFGTMAAIRGNIKTVIIALITAMILSNFESIIEVLLKLKFPGVGGSGGGPEKI